jgi:hypothetical protein
MQVLQRLALPSLKLGLPKSVIPTLSIFNTNAKVWVNDIPTHSTVISHCVHL